MNAPLLPRRPGGNIRAFTLVEILVSIGIVAVLVGLLASALSVIGGKSKEAKCLSNHRAIIQAVLAYSVDRACLPGHRISGGNDGKEVTAQKLSPYLNVPWRFDGAWKSQWFCPSRTEGFDSYQIPHYGFSRAVFGSGSSDGTNDYPTAKMSAINHPSKTGAISCVIGNYIIFSFYAFPHPDDPPLKTGSAADYTIGQLARWHGGRSIITFMDGHTQLVERYPKSDPRRFWFALNHPDAP